MAHTSYDPGNTGNYSQQWDNSGHGDEELGGDVQPVEETSTTPWPLLSWAWCWCTGASTSLGGFQGRDKFVTMGDSPKTRGSPHFINLGIVSWPPDPCFLDPRDLGPPNPCFLDPRDLGLFLSLLESSFCPTSVHGRGQVNPWNVIPVWTQLNNANKNTLHLSCL